MCVRFLVCFWIAIALLVSSGCASTLTSPWERFAGKSQNHAPEQQLRESIARTETAYAQGHVAPANYNYVADLTKIQPASCQTGES
jgi:hypothetical protein